MNVCRLSAVVCFIVAVLLVVPVVFQATVPADTAVIDTTHGDASIYVSAEPGRVWGYESCQQVTWRLSGIQAVKLNDVGVVGEGTQTICGTSPYLAVTFQDGASQYYWLPRTVVLNAEARLSLLIAAALMLAVPVLLSTRLRQVFLRIVHQLPLLGNAVKAAHSLPRNVMILVVIITLIGFAFRVIYVDIPMRIDEGRTFVRYGLAPLSESLARYDEPGNHLFHTLLAHLSYEFFGVNENWVVRLPTFLAGVLIIPATFAVGAVLHSRAAGLVAAAIVSASSSMIAYSVNARGYSILTLCMLLLILLGHASRRNARWSGWLVLAAVAALGFYTIPVMLYPYSAIMLWLLLAITRTRNARRTRLLVQWFTSGVVTVALTLLLYAPVVASAGLEALIGNQFVSPLPWSEFWAEYPELPGSFWAFSTREMPVVLQIGFAFAIFFGLLPRRRERYDIACLFLLAAGVTLALNVAQRVIIFDRIMLFALALVTLVAGVGVTRWFRGFEDKLRPRTYLIGVTAIIYAIIAGGIVVDSGRREANSLKDFESMLDVLEPQLTPSDGIATIMRSQNYEFYLRQHEFPTDVIWYSTDEVQRLFLAVETGQTPDEVLTFSSLQPDAFSEPRLVQDNEDYDLYVVERLG